MKVMMMKLHQSTQYSERFDFGFWRKNNEKRSFPYYFQKG